jgi:hypothetical protein
VQTRRVIFRPAALALAACLLAASGARAGEAPWGGGFAGELRALAEGKTFAKLAAAAPETIKYLAAHPDNPTTLPALVRLKASRAEGFDDLWWKQKNRSARALITAFFLCRDGAAAPDFEGFAKRFPPAEREERIQEITFVRAHRSAVAEMLVKAFGAADREGSGRGAYAAYAAIAGLGEGRALPQ